MQTTRQRLTPKGEEWRQRPENFYGRMNRNPSTFQVQMELLDRAVTLYWTRRPDTRPMEVRRAV